MIAAAGASAGLKFGREHHTFVIDANGAREEVFSRNLTTTIKSASDPLVVARCALRHWERG